MRSFKLTLFFLFFLNSLSSFSQDLDSLIINLSKAGFEQIDIIPVQLIDQNVSFKIFLEHRGINNPSEILKLASKICDGQGFSEVTFVILKSGIILFEAEFNNKTIIPSFLNNMEELTYHRNFSISKYRLNTFFLPDPSIRFGYFDDPVQSKINLLLGTDLILFRGASVFSSLKLPFINNLDNEGLSPTIGPTFFNYFGKFDSKNFFQISSGIFFNNRYGIDLQYIYNDLSKPWSLGFRFAQSGFYFAPKGGVFFNPPNDEMILINMDYLFSNRITVSLEGGQFLGLDRGLKVRFFKQYKNMELGFFGAYTNAGSNGGFSFMVPLLPRKIIRSKGFEFRGHEGFRWEYNYSNTGSIALDFNRYHQLVSNFRRLKFDLINSYE